MITAKFGKPSPGKKVFVGRCEKCNKPFSYTTNDTKKGYPFGNLCRECATKRGEKNDSDNV